MFIFWFAQISCIQINLPTSFCCFIKFINIFVFRDPEPPLKNHRLKSIDRLAEQLSIIKTDQAFTGYAMSYKVEIIEKKIQLYN